MGAKPLQLEGKHVLVMGLGRSGVATVRFLTACRARVTVTDRKPAEQLTEALDALKGLDVRYMLGEHDAREVKNADLVVLSPGVPHTLAALEPAWVKGIPVIGEMELAAGFIHEPIVAVTGTNGKTIGPGFIHEPIVAVTGTNGKTTTTELIGTMLENSGKQVFVGGNIGTPLIAYAGGEAPQADVVVAEVSSFQLDTAKHFRPATAVMLNIADDHLDRYPSFSAYAESKWRIFANQQVDDTAILNAMDSMVSVLRDKLPPRAACQLFSDEAVANGAQILKDKILLTEAGKSVGAVSLKRSTLIGPHNRENIAAACLAARSQGASEAGIQQAVDNFTGLPHRMERIKEVRGVTFINDSKATNVDAVRRALGCFDGPVVLIMGGRNKKGDFSQLKAAVQEHVKTLVVLGEAKDEIVTALAGDPGRGIIEARSMEDAVQKAWGIAAAGDTVLLSPACASFDMFDSYAQRGECFRDIVERME